MRSRGIKSDFFKDDKISELSMTGRLLFIGLWCLADREGRFEWSEKRIKIEVFPYDGESLDINHELTVIERKGFVVRYCVNGKTFGLIPNFLKHQRPHHTEKDSNIPEYKEEYLLTVNSPLNDGEYPPDPCLLITDPCLLITDSITSVDLGRPVDLKNKAVREIFEFWKVELNHSKSKLDLKRERAIKARLKDGYTVDDIKLAITGIKLCPHNMGQNDRNTVFDDIELICRSSSNVDRFISAHEIKNGNGSEHAKNVGYNKNGISKTRQREIENQRVIDRFLAANAQPEPENSGQGNGDSE